MSHPHALPVLLALTALAALPPPGLAAEGPEQPGACPTPYAFGARGDGQADDSGALQAALQTGKLVHLGGGRFRITRSLTIPRQGGLAGPGTICQDFDNPVIPGPPGAHLVALRAVGDQVRLEGFRIEKNFIDGSYACGIAAEKVKDVVIRNLDISGYSARYGIHLVECAGFEISGCHVHDFMMNTTSDMIADSPAGIRVTRSRDGVIAGNRVLRIEVGPAGRASLSPIRPAYGPQHYQSDCFTIQQGDRITISGNVCQTSGEGIDLLLSRNCAVSHNVVSDIWFQGLKLLGVSCSTVSANHLAGCYQGIGLASHSGVHAEASGNAIQGNVIRDTGSPGSFGIPGSERVKYCGTHAIDVNDPQCRFNVITGNVIVDTQETKTTASGVRNNGGPTNVVANNLFTAELPDSP